MELWWHKACIQDEDQVYGSHMPSKWDKINS